MRAESHNRTRWVTTLLIATISLVAAAAVLFATGPRGPGLTIDSTSYLLAADSYGRDISDVGPVLNGVFPPGYSAAIAIVGLVVDDLGRAAVLVNVASLVVALGLIGLQVWRSGRGHDTGTKPPLRAAVAAVVTVATVASSTAVLRWSGAAMSELLTLALVLGAIHLAVRGAETGGTRRWVLVGLVAGSAGLVRLVALGSAFGVAVGVGLLVSGSVRRRIVAAATVAIVAVITSTLGVPLLRGSTESRRDLAWHPLTRAELSEGLDTIAGYTLPASIGRPWSQIGAVVVLAAFALFVVLVARRVASTRRVPPACLLATTVAVGHLATVLGSMLIIDDLTPLDDRILLPLVPLVALAVGAAVAAEPPVVPVRLAAALALVVVVGQFGRLDTWMSGMRSSGMGYAHSLFDGSETASVVRALPQDTEVWTNDVSFLYLRADRRAAQLPSDTDNYTGRRAADYDEQMDALSRRLDAGAVIVYADYFDFTTLPDIDELRRSMGPLAVEQLSDGAVVRRARP